VPSLNGEATAVGSVRIVLEVAMSQVYGGTVFG
jgi:hypothetical protein